MRFASYLALSVAFSFSVLLPSRADEPSKATDYTATVTGVVCSACKIDVTAAMKKLPGVETVSFAKGDKDGTAIVTFNSTAPALTKEDAVKALGEHAKEFEVLSLEKSK
jgi:copper chaperone CopZ